MTTDATRTWIIRIPTELHTRAERLLRDYTNSDIIYGSKSNLVRTLISDWVRGQENRLLSEGKREVEKIIVGESGAKGKVKASPPSYNPVPPDLDY